MRAVPRCPAAWVTDCLPASRAVGLRRYGGANLARLAPAAGIAQWQSVVISVAKMLVRSQLPASIKMVVWLYFCTYSFDAIRPSPKLQPRNPRDRGGQF